MTDHHPRFVVRSHLRPWGRRWTWTLVARNGEPLATSEPYSSLNTCLDGIGVARRDVHEAVVDMRREQH